MDSTLSLKFPKVGQELKIIIESGHIYTHESPSLEHKVSASLGSFLSGYFSLFGASVEKWLFIDNYNPQFEGRTQVLDTVGYLASLSGWGFGPDVVFNEADLVPQAKEVLDYLEKEGYAGKHPNGKTVLFKGGVLLYSPEEDRYMCSLLDACLYLEKLKKADSCITVLESQYSSQQKGTLAILKKLDADTGRIFPFFYSLPASEGHVSSHCSNVFAGGSAVGIIEPALALLQAVARLSGKVSTDGISEIEVAGYDL